MAADVRDQGLSDGEWLIFRTAYFYSPGTMQSPRWFKRIADRRRAVQRLSDQEKKEAMRAMGTGSAVRDPEMARLVVDECQDVAAKVPLWLIFALGAAVLAAADGDWLLGFFLIIGAGPPSYMLWMRRRALAANLPIAEGSAGR